jgi:hypothetical protein
MTFGRILELASLSRKKTFLEYDRQPSTTSRMVLPSTFVPQSTAILFPYRQKYSAPIEVLRKVRTNETMCSGRYRFLYFGWKYSIDISLALSILRFFYWVGSIAIAFIVAKVLLRRTIASVGTVYANTLYKEGLEISQPSRCRIVQNEFFSLVQNNVF